MLRFNLSEFPRDFFRSRIPAQLSAECRVRRIHRSRVMDNSIRQLVGVIKSDPAVANVNAYTGGNGSTNTGFIYIALKPLNERKIRRPPNHQPSSSQAESSARGLRVFAGGSRSPNRRPIEQRALPVHHSVR
jgi:multidrug efflux pump subunit AcrB